MDDQKIYKLIKLFINLMGRLPRSFLMFFSDALALIWFLIDKRHRNIVIYNIQQAYPGRFSEKAARQFAKKNFKHTASIFFTMIWAFPKPKEQLFKYCVFKGLERIKAAQEKGRGVMLVSCHMGIFELVVPAIASVNIKLYILYRPLDFNPLERLILESRQRFGIVMVPLRKATGKISEVLKDNGIVATLLDQNVDWYKGAFVDFFGRPACTNNGLAKLVLKTKPVVLPGFMRTEKEKFILEILPEIPLQETGDPIKDIENNTQAYVSAIESMVRRYPEQYFWVHNRWKTKPYCLLDQRTS